MVRPGSVVMPNVDTSEFRGSEFSEEEREIVARILNLRKDEPVGALRASKPPIQLDEKDERVSRKAAYVWRMVAFLISPHPRHSSIPMTAEFDLPYDNREQCAGLVKELDDFVDRIIEVVPPEQWFGVTRWGKALHGTPD